MRTANVSSPRFSRNASCAEGYIPKSRISCTRALVIYAALPKSLV